MRPLAALSLVLCVSTASADDSLRTLAERGDAAALSKVLANGTDANAKDADGTTALHWAARADELDAVQALLAAGADAATQDRYGVTPLQLAAVNGNAR